jgi:phenylalanyl-tRNA synthetase alpha chain
MAAGEERALLGQAGWYREVSASRFVPGGRRLFFCFQQLGYREATIMLERLKGLKDNALAALARVEDQATLEAWRTEYLGKRSFITATLKGVGQLPPEERPLVGKSANEVRLALDAALAQASERVTALEQERAASAGRVDVTLPGRPIALGRLHPITQILYEIYGIFAEMGFQVYDAPDVETDVMNFQMLNIPPDHPARDMWSTFYTTREGILLRTHTSPGQVRAMREFCPEPVRVILPGRCYRYEAVTARSESMFYQVEGLAVGRDITMADLKGVLTDFARRLYGGGRQVRFRCSYFPFTEPSMEVDVSCALCNGAGCRICKHTGWVEISGAGMVHPQVLRNGGYDPEEFTGFAFGMGPDRIAMLRYGIDDIRYFYSDDLRFLAQF